MNALPLIRSALREYRKCLMYPHHLDDIRFLLSCVPLPPSCTLNPLVIGNDTRANQYIYLDQYFVFRRVRSDFLEKVRGNHSFMPQRSSLNIGNNEDHITNQDLMMQNKDGSNFLDNTNHPKISLSKLPPTEIDFLTKLFWLIKRLQGVSRDTSNFDMARSKGYSVSSPSCDPSVSSSLKNGNNKHPRGNAHGSVSSDMSSSLPPAPVTDIVRSAGNNGIHTDFFSEPTTTTSFPFAREFLSSSPEAIVDIHAATSNIMPVSDHIPSYHSLLLPPNGCSLNSPVILTKMTPASFIRDKLPTIRTIEDSENGVVLRIKVEEVESGFHVPSDYDGNLVVRAGLLGGGSALGSTNPRYKFTYQLSKMENTNTPIEADKLKSDMTYGQQEKNQKGDKTTDHTTEIQNTETYSSNGNKKGGILLVNTYIAVIDCCGDESIKSSKTTLTEYRGLMDMESNLNIIKEIVSAPSMESESEGYSGCNIDNIVGAKVSSSDASNNDYINGDVRGELCIPISSQDGPAAVKGKFYYKLVSNISKEDEIRSSMAIGVDVQEKRKYPFLDAPILCIEFPPLALRYSDTSASE
eukprot:Tbor_TRINITY_DN5938_c1_g1::TRINITY_DN5938_c1_g1_i1::g.18811::m.18811